MATLGQIRLIYGLPLKPARFCSDGIVLPPLGEQAQLQPRLGALLPGQHSAAPPRCLCMWNAGQAEVTAQEKKKH